MATYAIDSARTSERLSAFLSEIAESKPVDNYFTKVQTLEFFWGKKKVKNGGRQLIFPIGTGEGGNLGWGSDYDVVPTTGSDNARTVGYAYKSLRDSIVISKEELRETAGDSHKIFDLVDFKREKVLMAMKDKLNKHFYKASPGANEMESLATIVKATGSVGGVSNSDYSGWASSANTTVGDWATNGMAALRDAFSTLQDNKARPDAIFTTAAVYNAYEANIDVDVRYTDVPSRGNRGFKTLSFREVPLIYDADCTSGAMYIVDSDSIYLAVDSAGMMNPEPFQKQINAFVQVSLVEARLLLACTSRRSNYLLSGITT